MPSKAHSNNLGTSKSFARTLLLCLLVGFALLQLLGTTHRYLHASGSDSYAHLFGHAAPNSAPSSDDPSTLACQLFDLACSDWALTPSASVTPMQALYQAAAAMQRAWLNSFHFWAYQARAPPALI